MATQKPATKKSATKKSAAKKTPAKKSAAKKSPAKKSARKYGPAASRKVATELHELEQGRLRSGNGTKVTSRKQAIAIGLAEARREGDKVPPAPKRS